MIRLSALLTRRLYPKDIFLHTVVGQKLPKAYFSKAANLELFRSRPYIENEIGLATKRVGVPSYLAPEEIVENLPR